MALRCKQSQASKSFSFRKTKKWWWWFEPRMTLTHSNIITYVSTTNFLSIICKLLLNTSNHQETFLKLNFFMDQQKVVTDNIFMKTNQCDEPACGICVTTSTHHPPTTLNWSLSSNIDLCLEETRTPKSFGATHQPTTLLLLLPLINKRGFQTHISPFKQESG